ncbi:MAG TPA: class A beta-lactamase [Reyranella sp.]
MFSRRSLIAAGVGTAVASVGSARAKAGVVDDLAALETQRGGRLGVSVLDTGTHQRLDYRADERFAMCSTHKFLTVAAILEQVDRGAISLDRKVAFTRADLLPYAPVTKQHVDTGVMTVEALAAATTAWSDNTADNLLLALMGGPAGWTRYARSLGDSVSRLDRIESDLNSAIPGDPRDTSSPAAMVRNLDVVLLGKALSDASRMRLETWMFDSTITGTLLRAGMPEGWRVADKSGAGANGTRNDIGLITRPGAAPLLAAVYYTQAPGDMAAQDRVLADAGRIIARAFAV